MEQTPAKPQEQSFAQKLNLSSKINQLQERVLGSLQSVTELAQSITQSVHIKVDIIFKTLLKWMIVIVNEPSVGLFYVQNHFKNAIKSQADERKIAKKHQKNLEISNTQIQHTKRELDEICSLNQQWASRMQIMLDKLQQQSAQSLQRAKTGNKQL